MNTAVFPLINLPIIYYGVGVGSDAGSGDASGSACGESACPEPACGESVESVVGVSVGAEGSSGAGSVVGSDTGGASGASDSGGGEESVEGVGLAVVSVACGELVESVLDEVGVEAGAVVSDDAGVACGDLSGEDMLPFAV